VSSQVHWAAAIAAKSPLYKADAGTALVAEATRAAAAGGEGDEGRGPLQEDASVALVADATCAAAAGSEEEGGAGLGLPPRQAVAEDPMGSFSSATTEGGGRDRASAITFTFPGLCLTSEVSSARKASCRWTLAVHGSETLYRACVSGLWSVRMWKRRPSSRYLMWRTLRKAASSSLSKAEYFNCLTSRREVSR